jgi:hypothetical protein
MVYKKNLRKSAVSGGDQAEQVGDDGVVKESVPRDVSGGQCGQLSQTAQESEEPLHLPALRDFSGQGLRHDRSIHPARGLSCTLPDAFHSS